MIMWELREKYLSRLQYILNAWAEKVVKKTNLTEKLKTFNII